MIAELLATEGVKNPGLWYPTLLGILVVVSAVILFCGSAYLLLATNLGARLGFLVAAGALSGFMMLLSVLWMTTASPLNTLKGRVPEWKAIEALGPDRARSDIPLVAEIDADTPQVDATEATNVKAAADAVLVTQVALPGEELEEGVNEFALFDDSTEYLITETYEVGGGRQTEVDFDGSWPFLHVSLHAPKYAVVTVCPVLDQPVPFGDPIPAPKCDPDEPVSHVVFERDLGSLRVPPLVAFIASAILFGLCLLGMHWRERDLAQAQAAADAEAEDARAPAVKEPEPEPANA